jgi:carbamoyltransferase
MKILGISAFYHDSAAALIVDGKIVAAVEEERFSGKKHDPSFPYKSIDWILKSNNLKISDIDKIAWYECPTLKKDRIRKTFWKRFPKSLGIIFDFLTWKKRTDPIPHLKKIGWDKNVHFVEHHISHLAYSFLTSNFEKAVLISVDGVGEWDTAVYGVGVNNTYVQPLERVSYPNSLGMFYATLTSFLGFKPNSGEYKVMGLAAFGSTKDKFKKEMEKLIWWNNKTNQFEMNMKYFSYEYSNKKMYTFELAKLFNISPRVPESELEQIHKDIAFSLQSHYERIFFKFLNYAYSKTPYDNLCLSGGCAYNGTANGKILEKTKFKNVYIPPAPSDSGSAIGAALSIYYKYKNVKIRDYNNVSAYLGPKYTDADYELSIFYHHHNNVQKIDRKKVKKYLKESDLIEDVSTYLKEGKIIGWFQGRTEFGARALGNRSILANPCIPDIKPKVNKVIKKREGFRPFAPMVTSQDADKYFQMNGQKVPYMNQVVKVKDSFIANLPSITHVDGTARVQTLEEKINPLMHSLLKKFEYKSGYPILLNTSFNLRGQTMVNTPNEAIWTFQNCEMDYLVIGNYIISK